MFWIARDNLPDERLNYVWAFNVKPVWDGDAGAWKIGHPDSSMIRVSGNADDYLDGVDLQPGECKYGTLVFKELQQD